MGNLSKNLERDGWPLNGSEIAAAVWVFLAVNTCMTIFAVYPNATAYKTKWLLIGLIFINFMLTIRLFGTLQLRKKSAQEQQLIREIDRKILFVVFVKKIFFLLIVSLLSWCVLFLIRANMIYAIGMAMAIAMAIDGLFVGRK